MILSGPCHVCGSTVNVRASYYERVLHTISWEPLGSTLTGIASRCGDWYEFMCSHCLVMTVFELDVIEPSRYGKPKAPKGANYEVCPSPPVPTPYEGYS